MGIVEKSSSSSTSASTSASKPVVAGGMTPKLLTSQDTGQKKVSTSLMNESKPKMVAFDTGGVVSNEGVAFVHDKERILNPYQTELFDSLVRAMETMSRIMVPDVPAFGSDTLFGGASNSVSVGDIIVQVDKMETDADYEDMADKVLNAILERLNRGTAIGGIRFSR